MKIIAGLGNPEKKYEMTRHNIGFRIIDALAERYNIRINEKKHNGLIGKGIINGEKVILVKPQTYMNLSGNCIRPVCDYYRTEPEDCIIIYDDISLAPGKIRIRKKGSAGGHNGIKSIISMFGSDNFPRLKFGVGDKPADTDLVNHVLGRFSKEDEIIVKSEVEKACEAAVCMISEGYDAAMNRYNG